MRRWSLMGAWMLAVAMVGCGESEPAGITVYEPAGPAASEVEQAAADAAEGAAELITVAADDAPTVNENCPVSGRAVAAEGSRITYQDKVYGFCCGNCIKRFKEDPASFALAE